MEGFAPWMSVKKDKSEILRQTGVADKKKGAKKYYIEEEQSIAADPVVSYMSKEQLQKLANETRRKMEKAAKDLDFMEAAKLRDELLEVEKLIKERK